MGAEAHDQIHSAIAQRLRTVEQRYTPVRRALIEALASAGRPLSIVELLATMPGYPQSSVYRNLADLEQVGGVARLAATDDFARYELAEDFAGHHHHLLCTSCGQVLDFTPPGSVERALARAAADVHTAEGFRTTAHRIEFVGLCRRCA